MVKLQFSKLLSGVRFPHPAPFHQFYRFAKVLVRENDNKLEEEVARYALFQTGVLGVDLNQSKKHKDISIKTFAIAAFRVGAEDAEYLEKQFAQSLLQKI